MKSSNYSGKRLLTAISTIAVEYTTIEIDNYVTVKVDRYIVEKLR